ncbi:hypothetical protein L207DRAFT_568885 [Hyaloscypha variabilis F]|uniref:RING-type domain-containing protein n=1 Tax=Hyaloscypha variabilis (strain UAMH 11265 / GT02V1 / F) TaxID=1149755 RepID=A0A2J6RDS0_HYAVF|nr:hypothetical protein L207DRAFT_568885 [Hyaloscypha variabilis F]
MASWNARQLLDVYPQEPYFTCVGTTLKGLRCRQSFLKNVHKAEADRLLDLLPPPEHFRSNPSELLPTLRHLAWLTLCPRWHQNGARCQADAVASKWLQIISSSTPSTTTYTYGGYQAPSMFPISPPQTPPPPQPTSYAAAPPSNTYYTYPYPTAAPISVPYSNPPAISPVSVRYSNPVATLQPSPPLSHNQGALGASFQRGVNVLPHVSSSVQTTNAHGSTRIDINITVVLDQDVPSNTTHRAPGNAPVTSSVSSGANSRSRTAAGNPRSSQSSTHSGSSSSSVPSRTITTRDVQEIISRLVSLERQAARFQNRSHSASSRSSRSTFTASSRSANDPRSPIGSTISEDLPPPVENPYLFFSPPRSPAPASYAGSLSISTDSEPASSVVDINTPSSSGSSTPIIPPLIIPAVPAVVVPGPAIPPAAVQRRPITASTTCYVCYEHFQSPADTVWCRGTCGQNLCLGCFDGWIESRNGLDITCPFCRQDWLF